MADPKSTPTLCEPQRGPSTLGRIDTVRVLVIDDPAVFVEAVTSALLDAGIDLVGVVEGQDAMAFLDTHRTDVVLLRTGLLDETGLDVGTEIMKRWPETKVLLVGIADDLRSIHLARRAGFHCYLTKDAPASRLIDAIRAVAEGEVVLPDPPAVDPTDQLTLLERRILESISDGADSRLTASKLGLSWP